MNYHNTFWPKPSPIPHPKTVQCVLQIQHTERGTDLKQQPIMLSFYAPYANSHQMTVNHRSHIESCQQGLANLLHHISPCDRTVKLTGKRRFFIAKQIPVHNTICVTSNKLRAAFLKTEGFTALNWNIQASVIPNRSTAQCFPLNFTLLQFPTRITKAVKRSSELSVWVCHILRARKE
jgi:hypothetical protein